MISPELATKQGVVLQGPIWGSETKVFSSLLGEFRKCPQNSSVSLHKQCSSQELFEVSHLIILLTILIMNSWYIPSWFEGFSGRATGINLSSCDPSSIFPGHPFQKADTLCRSQAPLSQLLPNVPKDNLCFPVPAGTKATLQKEPS